MQIGRLDSGGPQQPRTQETYSQILYGLPIEQSYREIYESIELPRKKVSVFAAQKLGKQLPAIRKAAKA